MNVFFLLWGSFTVLVSVQAQVPQARPLLPTRNLVEDPNLWAAKAIPHDQVKPFPQPEPVTISEKIAVKFKPQIQIRTGCEPYPAVNAIGEVSGGLKASGDIRGKCGGSGLGSQVYGRSTWHKDVWAIMYAWYFPKDSTIARRHSWEDVVVFIDNPDVPEPKIVACSVRSNDVDRSKRYKKYNPCPSYLIDGTSLKVRYKNFWFMGHDLDATGDTGKFQDLIMWDQLTEDARRTLNSKSFGYLSPPMNDRTFTERIELASPF